jgi:hypothetical protein
MVSTVNAHDCARKETVMTDTNRTPFANALSAFLNHAQQADGKQIAVLEAVLGMESTFDLSWCEKFHTSNGKNKTAMIHGVLDDLYPEFQSIKDDAKEKVKGESLSKEKAQNKLKALENLIRNVAFAVAFFKLKEVTKYEFKAGRVRYVLKGSDSFDSKFGDTFKEVVANGRAATIEKKWTEAPQSAGKTSNGQTISTGAASEGSSVVATIEKAEATGNKYPEAFKMMLTGTTNMLEAKKLEECSEAENEALRRLENVYFKKVFGDSKGQIDFELIADLYEVDFEAFLKARKAKGKKQKPQAPVEEVTSTEEVKAA